MISISIIIPNYNGAEKALTLLDALIPQLRSDHEIVLVDDGSIDNSMAILLNAAARSPNIKVVQQINKGRAAARNKGASEARGRFLLFMDNDIVPSPSFIERFEYVFFLRPRCWITGTIIQDVIDCPHKDFLVFRRRVDFRAQVGPSDPFGLAEVTSFSTQQLGVPRDEFYRVGGFDEDLRDCEDFDLSIRAIDLGGVIIHDTMNVVRHADYATIDQFIFRQIEYGRARSALKRKKPELAERFPELFFHRQNMSRSRRRLRRIFLWSPIWHRFFRSRATALIPTRVRFALYDIAISSNFLLADAHKDV